jgi:hypothetical protein
MISKMFVLGGLIWFVIPVSSGDPHHHKAMVASVVNSEMHTPELLYLENHNRALTGFITALSVSHPQKVAAALQRFRQMNDVLKRTTKTIAQISKSVHDLNDDVHDLTGKKRFHRNVFDEMKGMGGVLTSANRAMAENAHAIAAEAPSDQE